MTAPNKTTVGDLLTLIDDKRRAHELLVENLPAEELRHVQRTGIHINRESGVIRLAIVGPNAERSSAWTVREDLGSLPLSDFPRLAESPIRGFVGV